VANVDSPERGSVCRLVESVRVAQAFHAPGLRTRSMAWAMRWDWTCGMGR
jgi:hypothetical protein